MSFQNGNASLITGDGRAQLPSSILCTGRAEAKPPPQTLGGKGGGGVLFLPLCPPSRLLLGSWPSVIFPWRCVTPCGGRWRGGRIEFVPTPPHPTPRRSVAKKQTGSKFAEINTQMKSFVYYHMRLEGRRRVFTCNWEKQTRTVGYNSSKVR